MTGKNAKISRFVHIFDFDGKSKIVYNSLNCAVLLLENKIIDSNFELLKEDEKVQVKEMGFLKTDEEAYKEFLDVYENFKPDTLGIIIEITQLCNMKCSYCYQNDWDRTGNISESVIEKLLAYISNSIDIGNYSNLEIGFFGGEALLAQKEMLFMYEKIKKICDQKKVNLKVGLQTNGLLLSKELLDKFQSLTVTVPLSSKEDHNLKRPMRAKGESWQTVIDNICECEDKFKEEKNFRLFIRYNTDHANKEYFEEFVGDLARRNIKAGIKTAYTYEHPYNDYKNSFSFNDYRIWNSSQAVDILVKNNFRVTLKPSLVRTPCTGYHGHNIKLFSDGGVGLCNAHYPSRQRVDIGQICDSPDKIKDFFPEKKAISFDNENCLKCAELALCGGKMFCKKNPCFYGFIDLHIFLKSYIKYVLAGKANLFDFSRI